MRITLILCFVIQLVFPATVNSEKMIVPHTKSFAQIQSNTSDIDKWSLESMLSLYAKAQDDDSLKVYPNPVNKKDMLNISMGDKGKKVLSFYDITGKMVKVVETERQTFAFSVADMGVGVYILNVKSANFQTTKKVIVK
ncbi:T9SS type A sorting domain-containing protein [Galbibacter sp. EGI 63066]|uniref:T9SS type A sorting domain-containing protein n=1 Tax=Galbibacter sp. EGI 63066 TaxID=2993559 RepID=UPI0022492A9A|nr:T9SS type A sorting domain-containing protein [Galbibacter sp. EGI 63066]MCX2678554.1 T9SS type A sorting domain-containing protein [Galbibacter sp. EGI 63066]